MLLQSGDASTRRPLPSTTTCWCRHARGCGCSPQLLGSDRALPQLTHMVCVVMNAVLMWLHYLIFSPGPPQFPDLHALRAYRALCAYMADDWERSQAEVAEYQVRTGL